MCYFPLENYVDAPSNISGNGAGIVLISPEEHVLEYSIHFEFPTTKNVVEYKAFLVGLCLAKALNAYLLQAHSYS
jgi:ribonuclease HI